MFQWESIKLFIDVFIKTFFHLFLDVEIFIFSADGLESSLCSGQKLSLETILGHYLAFPQDLPDYSSFISWAR